MPNSVIKSLAKKSNRPVSSVEKTWNDTVDMQLKKMKEDDPKFYSTVVTIVKKKLNIKEGDKEKKDDKDSSEDKVAGVRSITSKVVENFGNSLGSANIDYSNSSAGNGAYFGKIGGKVIKKKKKKKKLVKESSKFVLSSSVGSLKQDKPLQNLSEMELWAKRWKR